MTNGYATPPEVIEQIRELAKLIPGLIEALGGEGRTELGRAAPAAQVATEDSAAAEYFGDAENDPLYDQAVQLVLAGNRASISYVQRHLRIGYNRAARLLERMEGAGLVSHMNASGAREVIGKSSAEA